MALAYIRAIRNERENIVKQIDEATKRIAELDDHIKSCEAVLSFVDSDKSV
jgi:hypothetical protein